VLVIEGSGYVICQSLGPPLVPDSASSSDSFWEMLRLWVGSWMWEHVNCPLGFNAVVEAITPGTAIYVTNSSYNCKVRNNID